MKYLVTDTGFGTGLDIRPNPGIGFPGIANYFPVTKANPEPPRIRYPGGPAPGPCPPTPAHRLTAHRSTGRTEHRSTRRRRPARRPPVPGGAATTASEEQP